MTPTISEFSYGFALTNELIDIAGEPLNVAPIFPSLVEEGRTGGGYDVNLDVPGFPLFIQFKRSDCLVKSNTREIAAGATLTVPYYRFPITARARSDQHDMLCDLDNGANEVFYAAPFFHEVDELNEAYLANAVADRTFYIRPRDIGKFADDDVHHVAFDGRQHFVCSQPREVKAISGRPIFEEFLNKLKSDDQPLRDGKITEAIQVAEVVIRSKKMEPRVVDVATEHKTVLENQIQRLADLSLSFFGAQLFIVQPK